MFWRKVFAENGILNCRLTETEKFADLTYFFNGGNELEHPLRNSASCLPSPKPNELEFQPETVSFKITDKLLRGLEAGENDVFHRKFSVRRYGRAYGKSGKNHRSRAVC